jgi:hypothetical protein
MDDLLLDAVGSGYQWLHDRTGVPKGALYVLLMCLGTFQAYYSGTFSLTLTVVILAGCGISGLSLMFMQSFFADERVNVEIELLRQAVWRRLFYPVTAIFFGGLAAVCAVNGTMSNAVWSLVMPLLSYLAIARTRPRAPPPRIEYDNSSLKSPSDALS